MAKHPDLADVVDVWSLLDEPIRQAILALVRVLGQRTPAEAPADADGGNR